MRKYALDSNCYIDAAREPAARAALEAFTAREAPRLYLSAVVAAELRAGCRSARDRRQLEEHVLAPFVRRGRVLTPSGSAWDALGLTLSQLRAEGSLDLANVSRGFVFDVLIAFSCREAGVVLITRNARDMERIRSVFPFEFVAPFPPSQWS
ncbi:MAG TPA: type II toxin-antitoxin system VapC family toxin [Thermoanaerobaculia bacterium]|nr:type II toxin-antitoxin system VapC family toxin [Thermoanaerobaculia bacterium]